MSQRFEFVQVSGKELKGDPSLRRRVRSHAQRDYRRRNPPVPRPPLKVDLDVSAWLNQHSSSRGPGIHLQPQEAYMPLPSASSNEQDTSEQSAQTKMGTYAIRLLPDREQPRARLLWDHLYDETCVVFKSMLDIGFMDMLYGSSALMQMLSTSAYHLSNDKMQGSMETVESARYSLVATRSLRQQLETNRSQANMGTIMAILAFAAFAHLISDPRLIDIHLDGLSHALGRCAGLTSVETMPPIRIMIYWIDLSSALLQDILPRYPQPFHILSACSRLKLTESFIDRSLPCEDLYRDPSVSRILEGIHQLNALIDTQHAQRGEELWCDTLFPGFNIAPILYDLMSMSRSTVGVIQGRQRECFRLAAILYIIEIRCKFGLDPTPSIPYSSKLKLLLNSPNILPTWGDSNGLLLWTLIVGVSSTITTDSLPSDCMQMIQDCFRHTNTRDSHEQLIFATKNMWSYAAMGPMPMLEQLLIPLDHQQ